MSAPAPKPFSLQAPERIAMEYGGNKQKIAQAVQSGLVDPTAGLLAGMFIDRMRAAQVQEQAPNQTVAQQVLGPQGPQGGPPPGGPPPQGAPQGGPPPPPPPPPPQGPVGMAEGGLTTLPVPDYMFDEQTFAGGGIVAFADAGSTYDKLLAKAAELEADANSGKHSGYRRDALLGKARLLKIQARTSAAPSLGSQLSNLIPDYFQTPDVVAQEIQGNEAHKAKVEAINKATGSPAPPTAPPGYQSNLGKVDLAPFNPGAEPAFPGFTASVQQPTAAPVIRPAAKPKNTPPAAAAAAKATTPDDDYGLPKAPEPFDQKKTFDDILAMMGPAPKATTASAEEKAKDRNYDIGMALLAAASRGLSKGSTTFLGALGDAGEGAMPVLAESSKARRANAERERQAQFEQEKTEYGARGTAAAATRAEQNTMREYGLNLAQARARNANDKATRENEKAQLGISGQNAANQRKYYDSLTGRDAAELERIAGILSKGRGITMDQARVEAVNILNPGYTRGTQLTPNQALLQAQKETTALGFTLPPGMTTQQFINARRNELMGSSETPNPYMNDADKVLGLSK